MPNTEPVREEAQMDASEYEAPRIELVISEQAMQGEAQTPPPESPQGSLRQLRTKPR